MKASTFELRLLEGPTDTAIQIKCCSLDSTHKPFPEWKTKVKEALIESDEWKMLSLIWDEHKHMPGSVVVISNSNYSNFAICKIAWALIH